LGRGNYTDKIVSALKESRTQAFNEAAVLPIVITLSEAGVFSLELDGTTEFLLFKKFIESYDSDTRFFVPNTGIVGIGLSTTPIDYTRNLDDCIIAGLFETNLPVILRPTDDGEYKMCCLAYPGHHTLGDEYIEEMKPGADWKEAVEHGALQQFNII
jgi:hypothetical protein